MSQAYICLRAVEKVQQPPARNRRISRIVLFFQPHVITPHAVAEKQLSLFE